MRRPRTISPRHRTAGPLGLPLALALWLGSCTIWTGDNGLDDWGRDFGWRPVYITPEEAFDIGSEPPRAFVNTTTPVAFGDRLYVVDRGLGVHVIDNADPSAPVSLAFIRVPGITTATVTGGDRLYVDNVGDFVTLDIADAERVRVLDRDTGAFGPAVADFPEGQWGWFECVDPDRGFVVAWEEGTLDDPECRL